MADLFENVWGDQKAITVDNAVDITLPVGPQALLGANKFS